MGTLEENLEGVETQHPEEITNFNMLFFGKPGSGKTTLASTALDYEGMEDVLYLDINAGLTSIRDRKVESVEITDSQTVEDVIEWLRIHRHKVNNGDDLEDHNALLGLEPDTVINTLVVDVLTSLQEMILKEVTGAGDNIIKKGGNSKTWDDWDDNSTSLTNLVQAGKDLDVHSIFTCQQKDEKDEKTGAVTKTLDIQSSLQSKIPSKLDVVGYLYTKNVSDNGGEKAKRYLVTDQSGDINAKNRTTADIPQPIEEPTVPKLMEYLEGSEREQ